MMTLKELKKRVAVADKNAGVLGMKEILRVNAKVVVREIVDSDVEISVYNNGVVLYKEGKHRSLFRLHDCIGYDYQVFNGGKDVLGAEFFENENWYVLPLMIGMDRVEASRKKIVSNQGTVSLDASQNDYLSRKVLRQPDMLEEILLNETLKEIKEILNERQRYAVFAYYCDGISQEEIAKNLKISQQAASGLIKRALAVIRNYMNVNPSDVKRNRNKK